MWRLLFPTKEIPVQIELFGDFLSKQFILTHENSTLFINMPLKWGFLNFLSFPSFRLGSIAQSENPETLESSKSLKTLNFVYQTLKGFTEI